MEKKVVVYSQPGWMFCNRVKEFLSQKGIAYVDRDVSEDEGTLNELQRLGFMTTPVTVIGSTVVVGFDQEKLETALRQWE